MTVPLTLLWDDGGIGDEWNDGWMMKEMMTGTLLDGTKVWEHTYDTSASSFSLGGLGLGATSGPKRFDWVKMNLDTGAAVNTFPLNFGPDGAGDGRFYRTASGEWILDGGAWQFQGYDDNGLLTSLNGRLTVHTKCWAVLQRSRAKDDKISTSDMTVDF